jgi:hypothetical protein
LRLYVSADGKSYNTLVKNLYDEGYPNETSVVFSADTAFCLLRRDGEMNTGQLGIALPPYTGWEWKDLGIRIGGPHVILLPSGKMLAAVRFYNGNRPVRTSLCHVDRINGSITELLALPSGGDTSYAGQALHEGHLWVSYYSSHEGKTSIYLAKVRIQ